MTLRLTPFRLVGVSILAVMFAWLAWQIVTDTAGYALAGSHPRLALRWNSTEPSALVMLAQHRLVPREASKAPSNSKPQPPKPEDLIAASAFLKQALLERPLDSHSLALLALIAYQQREVQRGNTLAMLAGRLSWRDMLAQTLLAGELKRQRDYAGALAHADAILRTQLGLWYKIFPGIAAFSTNSTSWRAVAQFLAANDPLWRAKFLAYLCRNLRDRPRITQLYDELAATSAPPTAQELNSLFHRLIADGAYRTAYRMWRKALPADRQAILAEPYNGDFAHSPDGMQFDWTLVPTLGADMQLVNAPGMQSRALRIDFSGARVNFANNVRQLMLLPPGSYAFTGRARTRNLRTRVGLRWSIYCAGSDKKSLGHTAIVAGNLRWSEMNMKFTVPDQGCSAQWLTLELPARADFEKQIEGQAWFTGLRIRAATVDVKQ